MTAKPKNSVTVFVEPLSTIVFRFGTPMALPCPPAEMSLPDRCCTEVDSWPARRIHDLPV